MSSTNRLKARLRQGEAVTAAWVQTGSPDVAEAMVWSGWDTIVVDCEHGAAGLEKGIDIMRAVEAAGGDAVLRVPDQAEATFKRALDRGARSIMAPMINDAATAHSVAGFCRYPPLGRRGYAAPIVRASRWGNRPNYAAESADELLLMAQIEHIDAVRDFAAIAGTPGVDMAFIGPNDLAGSLNLIEQLDAAPMRAALAEIERKAREAGVLLGAITGNDRGFGALKALGYNFIVGVSDVALLVGAARAAAALRDEEVA